RGHEAPAARAARRRRLDRLRPVARYRRVADAVAGNLRIVDRWTCHAPLARPGLGVRGRAAVLAVHGRTDRADLPRVLPGFMARDDRRPSDAARGLSPSDP